MRIGIDLGGTKIEGLLIDDRGGERLRLRLATPVGDYDATVAAIARLVHRLGREGDAPAAPVGVGIPGTLSARSGLVKNANATWLIGRPLDRDLGQAIGREVRVANDANCFAISEAIDGAASGARVVFGVILGTGVGGGIAVDGQVLSGANGIAGEWGHNPLPWPRSEELPGPVCYCGRTGCIETFLSGPGLVRDFREAGGRAPNAETLVQSADDGDPEASAALARYADRLARALASLINVLDPDIIVLGGGLSNIGPLYADVPRRWGRWIFSDSVETRLLRNRHGDSSGVRGAAWLWPREPLSNPEKAASPAP
jgi:fructokinase